MATAAAAASSAAADGQSVTKSYAVATEATEAPEAQETKEKDNEILALIQERKTTAKHEKERIREISKKIKNCIRDNKRRTRQEKIQKILENLKGTKNISSIKSVKKRVLIPKVKNKGGETIKTRQGIANVLAKFYEGLYEGDDSGIGKGMDSHTIPFQNSRKMRFKMPSTASKKGKQKTVVEYELNNSKTAVTKQKKSGRSLMKLRDRRTSHQKSWRKIRIQVIYKKR